MSARRRTKWPRGSRYRRRRGGTNGTRRMFGLLVVAALVAGAIWAWPHVFGSRAKGVAAGDASALADSTDRAAANGDHDRSLTFAWQLADAYPRLSMAQRKLAVALHNAAMTGKGDKPGLRTSLERIASEQASLAAADSAMGLATDDADWIAAAQLLGLGYETLGLPIDAIEIYASIIERQPDHAWARGRAVFLRDRLRDPLLKDTP